MLPLGVSLSQLIACYRCATRTRTFDGEQEAYLMALACTLTPKGGVRWTLNLVGAFIGLKGRKGISYPLAGRLKLPYCLIVKAYPIASPSPPLC